MPETDEQLKIRLERAKALSRTINNERLRISKALEKIKRKLLKKGFLFREDAEKIYDDFDSLSKSVTMLWGAVDEWDLHCDRDEFHLLPQFKVPRRKK